MDALWHHSLALTVQFLKLLAFFGAVVLPASWVSLRRLTDLSVAARLGIGAATGFALFVVAAWYIGLWSFDYLLGFWIAQFPVAGWLGRKIGKSKADVSPRQRDVDDSQTASDSTKRAGPSGARSTSPHRLLVGSWPVFFPLLAGILFHLYAMHFSILSPGVDASFHCVIGQRQLDAGKVTTNLWPLEDLQLNYPIGSHLWLAVASRWTGLAVHEVFRHSFALALCAVALVIAAWAEAIFGTAFHGVAAALAFVFCAFQASLYPYTWGGLPSLMAMWLGMAALFCVLFVPRPAGFCSSALLFAATAMVHHHTLVALLGGAGVVAVVGSIVSSQLRALCRRLLWALAAALAVASIYVVPTLTRVGELDRTGVLKYSEPFAWPWEQLWSWPADALPRTLMLAQASITVLALVLGLTIRPKWEASGARALLLGIAGFWLVCFCTLDYGGRLVARWMNRPSIQPFTPSRFLFDAQFVLAILVGGGLVRVWEWLRRPAFRYGLVSLLACGAIVQTEPRLGPLLDDMLIPIGQWADRNLPPDALVTGSRGVWMTYSFHRESTSLFIPISERGEPDRQQLKSLLLNHSSALPWPEWRKRLGKPIYVVSYNDENSRIPPLVVAGPFALYDVNQ